MYFINIKFMKKIAIIGLILMLVGLCSILAGCYACEDAPDKDNTWISHGSDVKTKVVEIEGHRYIIMDGFYSGGIIHAESCRCRK